MAAFQDSDYWRAVILYGLNNATYKIALGKTLLHLTEQGQTRVNWSTLAKAYLDEYLVRLAHTASPQQVNPRRSTIVEQIIDSLQNERITYDQAIDQIAQKAFGDVIPRFQTVGTDKTLVGDRFYDFVPGKQLVIHDSLYHVLQANDQALFDELEARWSLLEGAFTIRKQSSGQNLSLVNDIRQVYLTNGYQRRDLTSTIPFLQGYQGMLCFYCGEPLGADQYHVDHVLPRQVLLHDEIWNLVLAHSTCNLSKSDHLVGKHYVEKLLQRNENIMGSNHPWKQTIEQTLGRTPQLRRKLIERHYENVKAVLGTYYWGGIEGYRPERDPFYRQLITLLNHR